MSADGWRKVRVGVFGLGALGIPLGGLATGRPVEGLLLAAFLVGLLGSCLSPLFASDPPAEPGAWRGLPILAGMLGACLIGWWALWRLACWALAGPPL